VSYDYILNSFKFHDFTITGPSHGIENGEFRINLLLERPTDLIIYDKHVYLEPGQKYKFIINQNKIIDVIGSYKGNVKIWEIIDSILLANSQKKYLYDRPINVFSKYKEIYNLKTYYLDSFFKKNIISKNCYNYAKTEFHSLFLLQIIGLKRQFIDSAYIIDSLINTQIDRDYFYQKNNLESKFYAFSLYSYVSDVLSKRSNEKYSAHHLLDCINISNTEFKGEIRDFINSYTFRIYCKFQNNEYNSSIDSLYEAFKNTITVSKYIDVIDTWYSFYKKANKELPLAISKIKLISSVGDSMTLGELIKININKNVIFDFWANWCSPCVKQIIKYNDVYSRINHLKYQVLFISLDTQKSKNIFLSSKVKSYMILDNESKNNLMNFFSVPPIPKSILFEKGIIKDLNFDFTSFLMKL
jgi:thiol-disulfide isomerase/thioredoxin